MELFEERGYAATTVEEIAARAGLTERTFFRYFADKREVLFSGSKELEKGIVDGIASAPERRAPLEVVVAAFEAAGAKLQDRRDIRFVRARYALVTNHAEIQERELIKLASLAAGRHEGASCAGRPRAGREPRGRGGHRRLQDRLRALGQREEIERPRSAYPRGDICRSPDFSCAFHYEPFSCDDS